MIIEMMDDILNGLERETFIKKGLLIRDEMGLTFESDKIRVDEMPVVTD